MRWFTAGQQLPTVLQEVWLWCGCGGALPRSFFRTEAFLPSPHPTPLSIHSGVPSLVITLSWREPLHPRSLLLLESLLYPLTRCRGVKAPPPSIKEGQLCRSIPAPEFSRELSDAIALTASQSSFSLCPGAFYTLPQVLISKTFFDNFPCANFCLRICFLGSST